MKFKSKKYKKRINTKTRNNANRKNKKVRISRSRKYKRIAKRYYKNNTHKRNKIQNGGTTDFNDLLALGNPELYGVHFMYRKIKINNRATSDSLFKKKAYFLVRFHNDDSNNAEVKFFSLKMTRSDSKSFTVGFRATKTEDNAHPEIKYISGIEMATHYAEQKKNTNTTVSTKISDSYNSNNAKELIFDENGVIKELIISDDTGVSTYIFNARDSIEFFRLLSNIRNCF